MRIQEAEKVMETAIIYTPLVALLVGATAGLMVGRYLEGRNLWVLPAGLSLVGLILIVRLTFVQEGFEEAAFVPMVALTGAVLPALFAAIMGTLGGRALSGRSIL